jgi:hypothetical protein
MFQTANVGSTPVLRRLRSLIDIDIDIVPHYPMPDFECIWFERLLAELNYELWVGDPAEIRAKQVRKQKNDRRDAHHLVKLMLGR